MILHWFRRDLRLHDNPALYAAHRAGGGAVIPVYIQSAWRGEHPWTGAARQTALCDGLAALAKGLTTAGTRLIVRRGRTVEELERLLRETGASAIYFNRSPDPDGRELERRVESMARGYGVEARGFHEVTAMEPGAVLTGGGKPFRVFTPYARAWMKAAPPAPLAAPGRFAALPGAVVSLPLPTPGDWRLERFEGLPKSGEPAALRRLEAFLAEPVFRYASERDIPSLDGTSRLSADLRWGTLSSRLLVRHCREALAAAGTAERRDSAMKFLAEVIWREFYMAVLWHQPEVQELEFQPQFRGLRWAAPGEGYRRWCEGTTGFPIVDAGMRQLAATGWMHNRVRMIVAMFLTKDLHLDWRLGEAFFMQHLADGEIASNNGGWQWSAGTGADAAPYFRIQNPWSQSARFDPDGDYIRAWVPELRKIPAARLHKVPEPGGSVAQGYPPPVVDHARERAVALEMYRRF